MIAREPNPAPRGLDGVFTISLDFELYWGVRDKVDLEAYGSKILGARTAISRLLDLFSEYDVHATWATVGFLFFDEKDELLAHLPHIRPRYGNPRLSPYDHVQQIGASERKDPYHYGRSLIRQIRSCPGQEVGTHTFSHYYCLEEGQQLDEFRADLEAAHAAARLLGVELRSLVFPRNQWRPDYIEACADTGIRAARSNESFWWRGLPSTLQRGFRLADSYVNISGQHCHKPSACGSEVVNVPSSRFLRPFRPRLAPFTPLRLRRIRASMKHAAEHGLVYHLWWHPHNFGACQEENFAGLRAVLDCFRELGAEYGMAPRTMGELASLCDHPEGAISRPGEAVLVTNG